MEVDLHAPGLLSCPNETIEAIILYLSRQDFVVLRQCSRRLAGIVSPILFKTVSTSFDRLHQLLLLSSSSLAPYVESLSFYETGYDIVQSARDPWPNNHHCRELDTLTSIIRDYHGLSPLARHNWNFFPGLKEENRDKIPPPKFKQEWNAEPLRELISSLLQVYKRRDEWQSSHEAFFRLYTALQGLENVKEINVRDGRAGAMSKNLPGCKELQELNEFFPVSEGSFYMMFRSDANPPQKGFLMIMMVLSALKKNTGVAVGYGEGWMKQGIGLIDRSKVGDENIQNCLLSRSEEAEGPLVLEIDAAKGFEYLTKFNIWVRKASSESVSESLLEIGMTHATQLEELSIGSEDERKLHHTGWPTLLPMFESRVDVVPRYLKLKMLRVNRFALTLPAQLSQVLEKTTPSLRHLAFIECDLLSQTWKHLLQDFSDNNAFTLDEFRLENSWCQEDKEKNDIIARIIGRPRFGMTGCLELLVPSAVSAHALTYFINSPGTENPMHHRKWRFFDRDAHDDWPSHMASSLAEHGIIYGFEDEGFEDTSDWAPEEELVLGKEWEDEDYDGPEFDTEYDFSAEESSDNDMEVEM